MRARKTIASARAEGDGEDRLALAVLAHARRREPGATMRSRATRRLLQGLMVALLDGDPKPLRNGTK